MQRPERFGRSRALTGVAVFLCFALLGLAAHASIAGMQQVGPRLESTAPSHAASSAEDCMPCVGCYVAPAPSAHGFSGESKEPDAAGWRLHTAPSPNLCGYFETTSLRAPVPARIAFCRWLV